MKGDSDPETDLGDCILWDDIDSQASDMFKVWLCGGELEWAEECWRFFQKAGLADCEPWIEHTRSLLRLVTLARIYQEFSGFKWDENPETEVDYLAEDLEIDSIALGILAAKAFPDGFNDAEGEYDLNQSALIAATDDLRAEIFQCLVKAYGDEVALYSRMCRTNSDTEIDGEDFTVTSGNCRALEYVMNSFQ